MSEQRILFLAPAQTVTRMFTEFKDAGVEVGLAENVRGASAYIRQTPPTLIISRAMLPGYRVEDLLAVSADDPKFPPVIVVAERASPADAERYLELGARDFWLEPLDPEKVLAALPRKERTAPLTPKTTLGGHRPEPGKGLPKLVGADPSIKKVMALARQVAPSRATVLISGESGTGKEVFARYVHALSGRQDRPFVAVNCAALPEHLLESELFGHEKGSFTGAIARKLGRFELASGGTILLDEISEMELGLQAKLLRVLQEGEIDRVGGSETIPVDVRVIATTNRDLEAWVEEGKFRQDLFFRINVIPLRLPPLRERGDDIFTLAEFFINMYAQEYDLGSPTLGEGARKWLAEYDWPGNVRELQNLMERAVLLSGGGSIEPGHFLLDPDAWPVFDEDEASIGEQADSPAGGSAQSQATLPVFETGDGQTVASAPAGGGSHSMFKDGVIPLHEMERIMIMRGLEQTAGNRTQAAELLGISVRTLRNKLNEYREQGVEMP
ncbi:MAG: sigma-54-dependent Fis family transcriptional regulator [Desulfovibrionaceae bacterium]|nr:sigma-54-dependent Fis family transcriptional regulator [Desulfovibrionaceae bacterium]